MNQFNEPVVLTAWSFSHSNPDPYCPPENNGLAVTGRVEGHPRFNDGERITSSYIVKADGREIETRSGTLYILMGPPDPKYVKFMENSGKDLDLKNPVKIVER